MNSAKQKLVEGKLVLCMGLRQARTVDIAMIAAEAGFDALYVDLQHSPLSLETASTLCAASIGLGITPLVRTPSHAADWISRALDGGAQGVVLPDVNNAEEAKAIVEAARFPPLGRRSVMGSGPALRYKSTPLAGVNSKLNDETLVIVMLETPQGIEHADAIARVPGIDVLLVGSNDLCTTLGIPGELRHPKLRNAYEAVARACKAHGKVLGVGGIRGDLELQTELVRLGARYIAAGNDAAYLAAAAGKDAQALRGIAF
jgi:2-keto-3-deoxy-L-rhamnonate aldolase RhmA